MHDWRQTHYNIICDFLAYLNSCGDYFVLKGGTSLMLCYGLDRFSEDIDLDGQYSKIVSIIPYVKEFCKLKGYSYLVKKDINTVKRCMIDYGGYKKLKIEVSYRAESIDLNDVTKCNGILVYTVDKIARFKISACNGRSKLRDLYDISFIVNNYINMLNRLTIDIIKITFVEVLPFEYVDYIVNTQSDDLIDSNKLINVYLNACSILKVNVH